MAELDAWMRWFRSDRMSQLLGRPTPDEHRLAPDHAVQVQEIVHNPVLPFVDYTSAALTYSAQARRRLPCISMIHLPKNKSILGNRR